MRDPFKHLVTAGLLVLASCSATGYPIAELAPEINATLDRSEPRIQAGDALRVTFWDKPEWNHTAVVRPDGIANFLVAGEVRVVGLSLGELGRETQESFRGQAPSFELDPDGARGESTDETGVSMFVVGEVANPGAVSIRGRGYTLFEAIAAAGGHLKATANLSNTILVRRLPTGDLRSWRLDADIYQWGGQPPIYVQPRDIVFVPNTAIDDVNIWVDQYIRQMLPIPVPVVPIQ